MAKSTSTLEILLRLRDEASAGIKGAAKSLADLNKRLEPAAEASRKFAVGLGVVATAAGGFGAMAVKAAANMESLRMGLDAVSGSSEESEKQLKRLKEVARLPGLGFQEAVQGSINLQAAGLSALTAERALQSFGNALATVGKGKAELSGVITALTQIASKGKVSAEEINQLNERIPQIRVAMKAAFGTSDTMELDKLGISSEKFIEGIIKEFEKLPPVMGGFNIAVENLQDTWNAFLAGEGAKVLQWATQFVTALEGIISNTLPKIIEKIEEFTTFLKENPAAIYMIAGAIMGALLPALGAAIYAFGVMMGLLLPWIALGAAIGLVIYGIVTAVTWLRENWDMLGAKATEIWNVVVNAFTQLKDGIAAIFEAIGAVFTFYIAFITGLVVLAFEAMGIDIIGIFERIKEGLSAIWASISETAIAAWNIVTGAVSAGWAGLTALFTSATQPIKDLWSGLWTQIGGIVTSVWEGIKTTIFGAINEIITKVNRVIESINSVAKKGGDALGIKVPSFPKIPMLAEGGIVTRPTLAMIGEGGESEAVIPLSKLGSFAGAGNITVNIQGDVYSSREAAIEMANEIARVLRYQVRI